MSQDLRDAEVVPVHRATFWLAAAGFLALAVGAEGMGFFPAYDRLDFALQALGPVLLAIAVYALNYVVHSFPQFGNEDWRPLAAIHSFCYAMGAVACALTAVLKANALKAGVSPR